MLNGKAAIFTGSTSGIDLGVARAFAPKIQFAVTELDTADSVAAGPMPVQASEQLPQPQPSILELNSLFFTLLAGLAAVFTVAAFLISTR